MGARGRSLPWSAAVALLAAGLVLAVAVVRSDFGVGFGLGPERADRAERAAGYVFRLEDNLSYVTWIQQARDGQWLFQDNYAPEPHPRAFFNALFLGLGRLSRGLGWHPIALLNGLSLAVLPLIAGLVYGIGRRLGLPGRAAFLALLVYFTAAGLMDVMRHVANHSGRFGFRFELEYGIDWIFPDLFPFYIALNFPYHQLGNALLLGLLALVLRAERPAPGDLRAEPVVTLGLFALAAALSRPYEPAALLVAYALYTGLRSVAGRDAAWRRRWALLAVLGLAIGGAGLYAGWLARHEVWEGFASRSLRLPNTRYAVSTGFGLLWLGAAWGTWVATARGYRDLWLASLWIAGIAVAFVGLRRPELKLAGGAMAAFAWLTGLALDDGLGRAARLATRPRRALAYAALAIFAYGLVATPLSALRRMWRSQDPPPGIDVEVIAMAEEIDELAGRRAPLVLADLDAGRALPALANVRVYAGHWSLTPQIEQKRARLRAAGFATPDAEGPPPPADEIPGAAAALLAEVAPEYVLTRADGAAARLLAEQDRASLVRGGERWRLFRWQP